MRSAPAASIGAITHTTFRNEPDQSATSSFRAFQALATIESAMANVAVGIQTRRLATPPSRDDAAAARNPAVPTPTSPQPETAVKLAADSIVWRI